MVVNIHPTSLVHKDSQIEDGCIIGPFCIIGPKVKIEKNVHLVSNVFIDGDTQIGESTKIYPFCVIGSEPQDLKYNGEETKIKIGKYNKIREHSTIHLGTAEGNGLTQIGDNCLLMVNSHIAHDVVLKNNIIIANNVLLAGHVCIEDNVTIGGGSAIHQHCRIGEHSFIGGMSGVVSDIVPYALFTGVREEGEINGINFIGLKRKGFSRETIHLISDCYHLIFSKNDRLQNNIDKAKDLYKNNIDILKIIDFITFNNSRNLCTNYRNKN